MRSSTYVMAIAVAIAAAGCPDRDLEPLNPCTVSGVVEEVDVENVDEVDLLFMVDDSGSMSQEQASLAEQLPRLVRVLASGDLDEDGVQDFPPVKSLHVGVVSSDMGTGGFTVGTCSEPNFGDDGILRTEGNTSISECLATYPQFVEFTAEGGRDPESVAADFSCVAQLGTGGCGFEQQLEAVLKALTPSASSVRFNMGTRGHGDGANAGFLRDESLLGVVLVTDEDDCSASDPELFDDASTAYPGNPNLRCFQYPAAVQPVERYVDGLLALREDPDLLVYGAISGVPTDLVELDADGDGKLDRELDPGDYEAILGDSRMEEMVDPEDPNRLRPSCNVPGRGLAFPPRRIVRVAQHLQERGANGVVQSICQADFGPALTAIIGKIADALRGTCLPRDLNPNAQGKVSCDVVEVLPATGDDTRCESIPGRTRLRTEDGREVCRVTQVDVEDADGDGVVRAAEASGPGWYYDDFTTDTMERCGAEGRRLSFTPGAEPVTDTEVRLECLQPVQITQGGERRVAIGTPCDPAGGDGDPCPGAGLSCDGELRTCQAPCHGDAACPTGWRCDRTRAAGPICRNPTCE